MSDETQQEVGDRLLDYVDAAVEAMTAAISEHGPEAIELVLTTMWLKAVVDISILFVWAGVCLGLVWLSRYAFKQGYTVEKENNFTNEDMHWFAVGVFAGCAAVLVGFGVLIGINHHSTAFVTIFSPEAGLILQAWDKL